MAHLYNKVKVFNTIKIFLGEIILKYAVVTVSIGPKFEKMAKITHPTIKAYADKINADFIVIDGKAEDQEDIVPHFAKLQINGLFDIYDRIIFVDTDVIIRPDTPNLFGIVPEDEFGIFQEGAFIPRRKLDLEMAAKTYSTKIFGMNPEDWKGEYYNSGVMVASRIHKTIFTTPDFEKMRKVEGAWDYGEQGWINLQLINGDVPICPLHYSFNRMTIMDQFTGEHRLASYIVHYAGAPDVIPTPNGEVSFCQFIESDIEKWNKSKDYSEFKRGIYIRVGGGMGDQIDAEPVVRYVKEKIYPEAEIVIASDWPRIFQHINCKCEEPVKIDKIMTPDQPYYKMETLPIPESIFGITVSHPLVHSTDYSSISCIKRTLPISEKRIKLSVTENDVAEITKLAGDIQFLRDSVIIHLGRGWASKTFPKEWWQEVIDGVSNKGLTVCLIGKHIGDDQGLVEVNAPENCIDLRNKTTVGGLFYAISLGRVLISNDSAPIHIAGAFDNYIISIPTCKRPDYIMPWRNGTQTYKATSIYKKLLVDDICNAPTQVHGQTIDWIPSKEYLDLSPAMQYHNRKTRINGSLLDYLPDPKQVIDAAYDFYDKSLIEG
jgi:hypothetical protein